MKYAPLLAADFKSADPEETGGLHASVSAQSAALLNDEGETMKAAASGRGTAPLAAGIQNQQNQEELRQNQTESGRISAESG